MLVHTIIWGCSMYTKSLSVALTLAIFSLGVSTGIPSVADAAKPDKCSPWPECRDDGEPPPPPPVESCANATGVFPSFAYSRNIYEGKHGTLSGHDLYIANSDGDCSIRIHTNEATDWLDVSYRQNGSQGLIVWKQSEETGLGRRDPDKGKPVVKMLAITVANGALINSSVSTAYMHPIGNSVSINDAELSPDGDTIFYSFEESDGAGGWVNSIHSIDVSGCTSECSSQLIVGQIIGGVSGLSMNSSGQRLYFSVSDGVGIGFVEVANSSYSDIRIIASESDLGGNPAGDTSVGNWDFDGDGSASEVLAVGLDTVFAADILDVTNCVTTTPPSGSSCLASRESTILRSGISGSPWSLSFHGEDLLVLDLDAGVIELVDTDSLARTPLLQGTFPDSAE